MPSLVACRALWLPRPRSRAHLRPYHSQNHAHGCTIQVVEAYVADGRRGSEAARTIAGLSPVPAPSPHVDSQQRKRAATELHKAGGDCVCRVCEDTVPAEAMLQLWCGHAFCADCWGDSCDNWLTEREVGTAAERSSSRRDTCSSLFHHNRHVVVATSHACATLDQLPLRCLEAGCHAKLAPCDVLRLRLSDAGDVARLHERYMCVALARATTGFRFD